MDQGLRNLLSKYRLTTLEDYENALKEVIQQLALLGLWRSKFYEHAAFYGGTAIRIVYGSRRFSEDLDFSLLEKNEKFDMKPFMTAIKTELEAFGFTFTVAAKEKRQASRIESAFIKGNTIQNLITLQPRQEVLQRFHRNQKIKIKMELDTDPPGKAVYEVKNLLVPIPFQIKIFSGPDLFAGKLHAVLCRQWKSRMKGRDYYDLVWFLGQKIPCRLDHLKERMIQTNHWHRADILDRNPLLDLLQTKFDTVDFDLLKKDVRPFIKDHQELDLWNRGFFSEIVEHLEVC